MERATNGFYDSNYRSLLKLHDIHFTCDIAYIIIKTIYAVTYKGAVDMLLDYVIGVKEASEKWGLSEGYIKNLCADGKIEAKKIGKTWVIDGTQNYPKSENKVIDSPYSQSLEDAKEIINEWKIEGKENDIQNLWLNSPTQSKLINAISKEVNEEEIIYNSLHGKITVIDGNIIMKKVKQDVINGKV